MQWSYSSEHQRNPCEPCLNFLIHQKKETHTNLSEKILIAAVMLMLFSVESKLGNYKLTLNELHSVKYNIKHLHHNSTFSHSQVRKLETGGDWLSNQRLITPETPGESHELLLVIE